MTPTPARALALTLPLVLAALLAPDAPAQKLLDKDLPPHHPANDPYTKGGDPELMEAAGYVSMGGFEFGPVGEDTDTIETFFSDDDDVQIRWIETAHFELGFALEEIKVARDDKDKVRAECARLAEKLKGVPSKPRMLDPWLRAHLYAQRLEDTYAKVQGILEVEDSMFPSEPGTWMVDTPYWGIGPYVGQAGKFEVFILPSQKAFNAYIQGKLGLTTRSTQRWNHGERDTLTIITHTEQDSMRLDGPLHGHVASCVAHNMINGFKHYSYEKPIWFMEGFAHVIERDLNPLYNSCTSSEGGENQRIRQERWSPVVADLIARDEAPSLAELTRRRAFAELTLADHFVAWSMIEYLRAEHPGFIAKFVHGVSGLKNDQNLDDGSLVPDAMRDLFKEELGMTYRAFDLKWREWASDAKARLDEEIERAKRDD